MNDQTTPDGNNVEKIRGLFLSMTHEDARLGRSLLEALSPSERDYKAIFSDDVMQSLVGEEHVDDARVEVWNEVTTALQDDASLLSSFKTLAREQVSLTADDDSVGGDLDFENTRFLNEHVAEILATADGQYGTKLYFNSIAALTPGVARILANNCRYLCLNGLLSLPADVAEALAEQADNDGVAILELNGLTDMPVEAEKALAKHKGVVALESIQSIVTHDLALKMLQQIPGYCWLESWDASSTDYGGEDLHLDQLTSLSPSFLEALRSLDEVEFLGDEEMFYGFGELSLNGITALTAREAEHLILHTGSLTLDGLAALTDEVAEVLARYRMQRRADPPPEDSPRAWDQPHGTLSLMGLTTISDEAKTILRGNPNIRLPDGF